MIGVSVSENSRELKYCSSLGVFDKNRSAVRSCVAACLYISSFPYNLLFECSGATCLKQLTGNQDMKMHQ